MTYFIPKWKEMGFSDIDQWTQWKADALRAKPCKKCGGKKKPCSLISGKIHRYCPKCQNERERRKTQEAPGRRSSKGKAYRLALPDNYIASLLDIPTSLAKNHPELIETKRKQIEILRTLKQERKK